jgi:hypothetical protein
VTSLTVHRGGGGHAHAMFLVIGILIITILAALTATRWSIS